MQRESLLQENLRKKIQYFLNFFKFDNDLESIIGEYSNFYVLFKNGILENTSQLPDIYSKLRIPFDKNKAFIFDAEAKCKRISALDDNHGFNKDQLPIKFTFINTNKIKRICNNEADMAERKISKRKKFLSTAENLKVNKFPKSNLYPVIPFILTANEAH